MRWKTIRILGQEENGPIEDIPLGVFRNEIKKEELKNIHEKLLSYRDSTNQLYDELFGNFEKRVSIFPEKSLKQVIIETINSHEKFSRGQIIAEIIAKCGDKYTKDTYPAEMSKVLKILLDGNSLRRVEDADGNTYYVNLNIEEKKEIETEAKVESEEDKF